MKQSVQLQKRKAPTPAMHKPRNTTGPRPGIVNQSNHSRLANDKWERQADDVSTRVLRGEKNVARHLTPVRAASFYLPGSRGKPLPEDTLNTLEASFGADLSAVRIHNDTPANMATRQQSANAFTSGSHIYFRERYFDPDSQVGLRLLSHEVGHVLQQTGRPAFNGRIRATDIKGFGEIQREVNYREFRQPYTRHAELPGESETHPTPNQVQARDWSRARSRPASRR